MKAKATRTTPRIKSAARAVNQALARLLVRADGSPPVLTRAMRYSVLPGGKRFRPLLCLGGCTAVGGRAPVALRVACAIEMIHAYSLVHDDLPAMDNAARRRGRPSCHRQFGQAMAILAGDALLTRAFELLGGDGVPKALRILRAIAEASGTSGLIGGQVLDLDCGVRRADCGVRRLEEIARRKTAALITVSVVAGGLAGGGSSRDVKRLQAYGRRIGLAFQLIDDLHDADGLVRALGPARLEARALGLIAQAKRQLAPLQPRAQLLAELADWLAETR